MAEFLLEVPRIRCAGCKAAIEKAFEGCEGVWEVQVDIPKRMVRIIVAEGATDEETARRILAEAGYPARPKEQ